MIRGLPTVGLAISLGLANSPAGAQSACVQVQVAGQKPSPFDCLNQELQAEVQGAAPSSSAVPLGAGSPANAVGTFNEQSVSEQYGQNFGHSAIPYRPPPPVYGGFSRP